MPTQKPTVTSKAHRSRGPGRSDAMPDKKHVSIVFLGGQKVFEPPGNKHDWLEKLAFEDISPIKNGDFH